MNTHARITYLLLLSASLLPNVAWCWDDGYYQSQANPSGYSGYYGSYDNYRPHSGRDSRDYDRYERYENKYERRETPQEYQYRKLGEYNQAKVNQQAELLRLQAEYQREKYRMEAEAQLRSLQK